MSSVKNLVEVIKCHQKMAYFISIGLPILIGWSEFSRSEAIPPISHIQGKAGGQEVK